MSHAAVRRPLAWLVPALLAGCAPGGADPPGGEHEWSPLCVAYEDDELSHFKALLEGPPADGGGARAERGLEIVSEAVRHLPHVADTNATRERDALLVEVAYFSGVRHCWLPQFSKGQFANGRKAVL
jgi:hypothetical protein